MATYTNPAVFSEDKLCIGEVQSGDVFPPALIPVSAQSGNLLRVAEDGLVATADGLISQEADNILVSGAAGLYADMGKAVAENDKVLSVADNQIHTTLSLEFTKASELVLRGVDGAVVGSVRLPVVPGLPVIVEYLGDVTPPEGSVVIGGVVGQTGNYLHMRFLLNDDTLQDVFINFAKIFNLNIGNGLAFTSTGAVVVRPATGGGVVVDENGVSVSADYIRQIAEIVVAGSGQPLPGGGIVTDAATGMLKLDCAVVQDCVSGGGSLAESLIKPGGGLTTDSQGRLAVSCSAITPCIQGVVDTAVSGVTDELAGLKLDVAGVNATAESAQAQSLVAAVKADEASSQAQSAEDKADAAALAAANALSKAEEALASEPDLSGYLPLSGGEVTGDIKLQPLDGLDYNAQPEAGFTPPVLAFRAKQGNRNIGQTYAYIDANGAVHLALRVLANTPTGAGLHIEVVKELDGSGYSVAPHPRDNYGQDIVTTKFLKDYYVRRAVGDNLPIYVGGANASDTADLGTGRGLTSDKPFAGLAAALLWVSSAYSGSAPVSLYIQGPVTWDTGSFAIYLPGAFNRYNITTASGLPTQTITLNKPFAVGSGNVVFFNLNFQAADTMSNFIICDSVHAAAHIELTGEIGLSGAVTNGSISATNGGTVVITTATQFSGEVTGPRYYCSDGGRIIAHGRGEDLIPGTSAGTLTRGGQYL